MVVFRSKTTTCSLPVAMWMKSAYLPSYPSVPPLGTMPRAPLWLWLEDPQCLQVLEEGGLCFPFELKPAVNGVGEFHDGLGGGVAKQRKLFSLGKFKSNLLPADLVGYQLPSLAMQQERIVSPTLHRLASPRQAEQWVCNHLVLPSLVLQKTGILITCPGDQFCFLPLQAAACYLL